MFIAKANRELLRRAPGFTWMNRQSTPLVKWTKRDHFGEVAFLEGAAHSIYPTSVKAETPLDLIVVDRADFTNLAQSLGALQRDLEPSLFARTAYARFTTMWLEIRNSEPSPLPMS